MDTNSRVQKGLATQLHGNQEAVVEICDANFRKFVKIINLQHTSKIKSRQFAHLQHSLQRQTSPPSAICRWRPHPTTRLVESWTICWQSSKYSNRLRIQKCVHQLLMTICHCPC